MSSSFRDEIARADQEAIVLRLANGADPNEPLDEFDTPLSLAAGLGHVRVIDLLMDAGADPNRETMGRATPLCKAVANGNVSAVKRLIKRQADVDLGVPLQIAVRHEQLRCVTALLDSGANPNPNLQPKSLLNWAAMGTSKRAARIAEALIRAGADVNFGPITPLMDAARHSLAFEPVWGTPLMGAAFYGKTEIVRLLLSAGADATIRYPPDHRDSANMTARDVALTQRHKTTADLIDDHLR
jgi:ankyrin repeat protein